MEKDKGTESSEAQRTDGTDAEMNEGAEPNAGAEPGPAAGADGETGAAPGDKSDGAEGDADEGPGGSSDGDAGDEAKADPRFEELSDRYVRLAADFDNFRRRTRENERHIREQAAANLIKELLPIIDNLQLALGNAGDGADDGFVQGIQLIEQQLLAALHNHGLRPLETAGEPFDPRTMEAVAQIDGGDQTEPGHVVEELRRGYMLHDVVLRAAQVVVARHD